MFLENYCVSFTINLCTFFPLMYWKRNLYFIDRLYMKLKAELFSTCSCQSMSVPTVFFLSFDWANTGILKWELNMFSWGVILESNLFSGNILVLISVVLCSLTFILLFNLFNYPVYDLLWVFIFTYIWPVLKTNMTNHSLLLCFFFFHISGTGAASVVTILLLPFWYPTAHLIYLLSSVK